VQAVNVTALELDEFYQGLSRDAGSIAAKVGVDNHSEPLRHFAATGIIGPGHEVRTVVRRSGHRDKSISSHALQSGTGVVQKRRLRAESARSTRSLPCPNRPAGMKQAFDHSDDPVIAYRLFARLFLTGEGPDEVKSTGTTATTQPTSGKVENNG
jgi:hypothetical protein